MSDVMDKLAVLRDGETNVVLGNVLEEKERIKLTDEHRAQVNPWHAKWVAIAMRTDPQTPEEQDIMREAVNGLYRAAKMAEPRYILFAPSPVASQIVSGVLYYAMETQTPVNLNVSSESGTVRAALSVLANPLEAEKLLKNTDAPVVMDDTKRNWGRELVHAMFPDATQKAWDKIADEIKLALNTYSGGNMWTAGVDTISFFRHVVKLDIDYSEWQHYETASIYAGFRFMYADFCVVTDFPSQLFVDADNQGHNAKGPSHVWRDGFEIYNYHGELITPEYHWIINQPEQLTPDVIEAETDPVMKKVMQGLVA